MSRLNLSLLLLLTLTLIFSSCRPDNDVLLGEENDITTPTTNPNTIKAFANVDQSLWPYFQRFEEQAAARGYSINLNELELTGDLQDLPGENVGGQCTWHSSNPNHITIDEPLFNDLSDLYREFIIFHELGHCVLNRDHREDSDHTGSCVSLMRSGLGNCNDNYHNGTRATYIDELFDPNEF